MCSYRLTGHRCCDNDVKSNSGSDAKFKYSRPRKLSHHISLFAVTSLHCEVQNLVNRLEVTGFFLLKKRKFKMKMIRIRITVRLTGINLFSFFLYSRLSR